MVRPRSNLGRRTRRARAVALLRASQSDEQRAATNSAFATSANRRRAAIRMQQNPIRHVVLERAAFAYDSSIDYASHQSVSIGGMDIVCKHCKALKFKSETPGVCCANGQVKSLDLMAPPEPLLSLILGGAPNSSHFLKNIQKYNSCFQMTSFGATNIIRDNFMPTFKVILHELKNNDFFW